MTFFEGPTPNDGEDSNSLFELECIILIFLGLDSIITVVLLLTKKGTRFALNPKR
jgi:two pore calcium channel protein 1/two pore calcium channel protein 3